MYARHLTPKMKAWLEYSGIQPCYSKYSCHSFEFFFVLSVTINQLTTCQAKGDYDAFTLQKVCAYNWITQYML